jgi:nitronate monooxygenase
MRIPWNQNRLTAKLGVEYPFIQGPLGGLASQRLTAAVSNFGGLGSFGAHGLAPGAIEEVIAEIRSLTTKPFAMKLWVSMEDEGARSAGENEFQRGLSALTGDFAALGVALPTYKPYSPKRFEDQVRVLLDANVPVFSFIFGIPAREVLEECRARGIVTIGAATTSGEAARWRRLAWMSSPLRALKRADIAAHFCGLRKIRSPARCPCFRRSLMSSMCR